MSIRRISNFVLLSTALLLTSCISSSGKKSRSSSIPTNTSEPSITSHSEDSSNTTNPTKQSTSDSLNPTSSSDPTSQPTSSSVPTSSTGPMTSTSSPTNSSSATSSTSGSGGDEDIEDYSDIESIKMNSDSREIEVKVGKRSESLTISFTFAPGVDENKVNKDVVWTSSDELTATVDQYGRVSGVAVGTTLVTCTTVEGSRRASAVVHVIDSDGTVTKEWQKVTHESELKAGDLIIIGCPEAGVGATSEHTGMYLHPTEVTYSGDKNKILNPGLAEQFMLDGQAYNGSKDSGWLFENEEGKYLCTTHTGKVTFIYKTGNNRWFLYNLDGDFIMESTSNVDGWMMYNAQHQKFTTYESNSDFDMFYITLYKQVRIYE